MSVPTSSETGSVRTGWIPQAAVYTRELARRDGHAAGTLVAQAEDPFVVGHDDEPDVLVGSLAQQLGDAIAVCRRDPRAAGPPDDVAELLAGTPDRRRVDDRHELLEVVGQEAVEQRRVAVLERGQADVLLEGVALDPEVLELEGALLLDGQDPVGQQAAQAERLALVGREGEFLGQQPAAEEGRSGEPDRRRAAGRDVGIRVGQGAHHAEDTGPPGPSPDRVRTIERTAASRLRKSVMRRDGRGVASDCGLRNLAP